MRGACVCYTKNISAVAAVPGGGEGNIPLRARALVGCENSGWAAAADEFEGPSCMSSSGIDGIVQCALFESLVVGINEGGASR